MSYTDRTHLGLPDYTDCPFIVSPQDMSHDVLLFDLDGTISDPLEGIERSINFALVEHGFPPLAPG